MITNLLLKGAFNIEVRENLISIGKNKLSINNDIPIIRYRFSRYSDDDINYIKENLEKFNKQTHLIEISIDENTREVLEKVKGNKIATCIRIPVTDSEVACDKLDSLELIRGLKADMYVLVDNSSILDMIHFNRYVDLFKKELGIKKEDIGLCNSPLAFNGLSCLSAIKARELMAKYSDYVDVPLPTANHQTLTCCGCIKQIEINSDMLFKESSTKNDKSQKPKKEKKDTKPKNQKVFTMSGFRL